jgi:hypothetical protein
VRGDGALIVPSRLGSSVGDHALLIASTPHSAACSLHAGAHQRQLDLCRSLCCSVLVLSTERQNYRPLTPTPAVPKGLRAERIPKGGTLRGRQEAPAHRRRGKGSSPHITRL